MARKELLLYNYYLSNYSVEAMITKIEEARASDVDLRVCCFGGEVFATWGLFAKVKEHGSINMKVDGIAASGAGNLLLYAKTAECLSVSRVMLHRADANVESESQKTLLNSMNADLRKQLEMKVDADKFKSVTGYTIDQMFDPNTRVDIWLTAAQLKKLGIVSKVVQLTPEQEQEVSAKMPSAESDPKFAMSIAAFYNPEATNEDKTKTDNTMTLEKLKAEFPVVYAAIIALGHADGVSAERDRVGEWMAYSEIDPKAVAEGITKGDNLSRKVAAEFSVKAMSPEYLEKLKKDSAKPITTDASGTPVPGADAKAKELSEFEKNIDTKAGLKKVA